MKKTLFLLITILMISFIGCSDDDDSEYKDAIIGTWELTQIEFGGGWTSIPRRTYATFNSDGTYNGRRVFRKRIWYLQNFWEYYHLLY